MIIRKIKSLSGYIVSGLILSLAILNLSDQPHKELLVSLALLLPPLIGSLTCRFGINPDEEKSPAKQDLNTNNEKRHQLALNENKIMEMLATGQPLPEILDAVATLVETQTQGMHCSIVTLDENREKFCLATGPGLPEAFNEAIDGIPLKNRIGTFGAAVSENQTVVSENISIDPLWKDLRNLPLSQGLLACWALPIQNKNHLAVGAIVSYFRETRRPSEEEVKIVRTLANLTGIAIEHKSAEKKLEESYDQMKNLYIHLESVREEERTRIAREVHDELGQMLTALKMELLLLENRFESDQEDLKEDTQGMIQLVDSTVDTVRRISQELRPGILGVLGLPVAIEWQAEEFQVETGIKCEFNISNAEIDLEKERSTAIFRIFQESLTNIVRHANANRVFVTFKEKSGNVILKVRDNGVGITDQQIADFKSVGLLGMRERAMALGGELGIEGEPGKGTTVRVSIPVESQRLPTAKFLMENEKLC